MNQSFKTTLGGVIFSLLATIFSIQIEAKTYVPFTTEYFGQGLINEISNTANINHKHITTQTIDGQQVSVIDVDGPTAFNFTYRVVEGGADGLKGINLFKNVSSITLPSMKSKSLRVLDCSGMTKLGTLTFNSDVKASPSIGGNDATMLLTTIRLDGTAITSFKCSQAINLHYLSLTGCKNLTDVVVYGCDITGLDLSAATNIQTINVSSNPRLSTLRLPKSALKLTSINVSNTSLVELDIPSDMGYDTPEPKWELLPSIDINVSNSRVRKLDFPEPDAKHQWYFTGFQHNNACVASVNVAAVGWSGGTSSTGSAYLVEGTQNLNIGHAESVEIWYEGEPFNNTSKTPNSMVTNVSYNASELIYDEANRTLTFVDGVNKSTYTTCWLN